MSRTRSNRIPMRAFLPALVLAALLTGCADPDFYYDRRDKISLHAGDAVASNIVVHTVDPWPRAAGNRNISSNGEVMQSAVERYRTGKVIPPRGLQSESGGGSESAGVSVSE